MQDATYQLIGWDAVSKVVIRVLYIAVHRAPNQNQQLNADPKCRMSVSYFSRCRWSLQALAIMHVRSQIISNPGCIFSGCS